MASILKERAATWCKKNSVKAARPLPHEALEWTDFECDLYFRTFGMFNPRRAMAESGKRHTKALKHQTFKDLVLANDNPFDDEPKHFKNVKGRTTVICPTMETRRDFHEHVWESFDAQQWTDKELIVIETFQKHPSGFWSEVAREDPRVTYLCYKRPLPVERETTPAEGSGGAERRPLLGGRHEKSDFSIGLKRNIGVYMASGEYIVHFDDDDIYGPRYLPTMVKKLKSSKAMVVKLASWFVMDLRDGAVTQVDPLSQGVVAGYRRLAEGTKGQERLYGSGFSYVYRRSIAMENPFMDASVGEDFDFVRRILDEHGKPSVALLKDVGGICLHIQHDRNMQETVPTRDLSDREEIGRLQFATLAGFNRFWEVFHVGAAISEYIQYRFPDLDAEVQDELEAALLHNWSMGNTAGIATGRTVKRPLETLVKNLDEPKDALVAEVWGFVHNKFNPISKAVLDGNEEEEEVCDPAPRSRPSKPEARVAPDGEAYTKEQFIEFYGGLMEWEAAPRKEDEPETDSDQEQAANEPLPQAKPRAGPEWMFDEDGNWR